MRREAYKGPVTAPAPQEGNEIEAAGSPSGETGVWGDWSSGRPNQQELRAGDQGPVEGLHSVVLSAECTRVGRRCPEGQAEQSWELTQDWLVCVYSRQSGKDLLRCWHWAESQKSTLCMMVVN